MKQLAWLIACALVACQRSETQPSAGSAVGSAAPASSIAPAYRQDIDNLCEAVVRSGAEQRPASEHTLLIAQWLGANLTTEESHKFLVKIEPLRGAAKADALEAEAARVGLSGCALAAVWRAPTPTP